MSRLWVVWAAAALLAVGCPSRPPAYVPGEVPTEVQLERMTEEEKRAGMAAMMEKEPPAEMTKEEKAAESQMTRESMRLGTAERIADFVGRAHSANGMARFVKKDGKSLLILSEDFSVDAGPQLYVYLSGHPNPSNSAELHSQGDVELGRLKSTTGGQVYEIPADKDPSKYQSVVIYCKPFRVVFAVASVK